MAEGEGAHGALHSRGAHLLLVPGGRPSKGWRHFSPSVALSRVHRPLLDGPTCSLILLRCMGETPARGARMDGDTRSRQAKWKPLASLLRVLCCAMGTWRGGYGCVGLTLLTPARLTASASHACLAPQYSTHVPVGMTRWMVTDEEEGAGYPSFPFLSLTLGHGAEGACMPTPAYG